MRFNRPSPEKHKNYAAVMRHTFAADDSNPRDIWRPNDSTEMKARQSDGSLLISEDGDKTIWRVSYQ
jgi:glucose/arabinose dehydrogenase